MKHTPDAAETAVTPGPDGNLTPEQLAAQWADDAPEPGGRLANAMGAVVALGVGLTGTVISLRLGLGTPAQPQAGMWPFLISLAIAVLAAFQLLVGGPGGGTEKFSRYSALALFGFLTLTALGLLMPVIGFEIPSLLLCFVWMRFLGGETWRSAIIYSLLVVGIFYTIFVLALGTSIPHLF